MVIHLIQMWPRAIGHRERERKVAKVRDTEEGEHDEVRVLEFQAFVSLCVPGVLQRSVSSSS